MIFFKVLSHIEQGHLLLYKLNLQLLATNKSKKKNFSLDSVNNKRFKTNSSDDEKNLEHFKTNSRHKENPLTTHSNAS